MSLSVCESKMTQEFDCFLFLYSAEFQNGSFFVTSTCHFILRNSQKSIMQLELWLCLDLSPPVPFS